MSPQTLFSVANYSKAKQIRCICFLNRYYKSSGELASFFVAVVTKAKKRNTATFQKGELVRAFVITTKTFFKLNFKLTGFLIKQHTLKAVVLPKNTTKIDSNYFTSIKIYSLVSFFMKQKGLYKVFSLSHKKFFLCILSFFLTAGVSLNNR